MADGFLPDSGHHGLHHRSGRRVDRVEPFGSRGYFAHRCARAWSWLILKTTGVHVRVEGLERVTPGTTYVFVSNHQSIYDTPVLFASLPYQLRIIAKESLARFPVLGWHLKRGRHLFVDRKHPDRVGILKRWRALISEGLSLHHLRRGDAKPRRACRAFQGREFPAGDRGRVAGCAGGGHRHPAVMPKGQLRTEPANVTLIVHDPIPAPALERPTVRDAKAFADRAHAIVAATVEARQFGCPAAPI